MSTPPVGMPPRTGRMPATRGQRATTDHVLVETWTLIRHRLGRRAAERFWEGLRFGAATVETAGAADLDTAWEIGRILSRPGLLHCGPNQLRGNAAAGHRARGLPGRRLRDLPFRTKPPARLHGGSVKGHAQGSYRCSMRCSASMMFFRISLIRVRWPAPLDFSQASTLGSRRTLTGTFGLMSRNRTI